MKVVIAGSRSFNDYAVLKMMLDQLFENYTPEELTIISGGAKGADRLGEKYAKEKGIKIEQFIPDWDGPAGKGAGHVRNREMAKAADAVVCFTNGSNGTANMIKNAKEFNLPLVVYDFEGNEIERIEG